MFTGSPDFDDEGEEHVPEEPVRYVGKPTKEVDAAWDRLTDGELAARLRDYLNQSCQLEAYTDCCLFLYRQGRHFLLSEKEARETWGGEAVEHWDDDRGGYLVG